jgi:hypothetical protein
MTRIGFSDPVILPCRSTLAGVYCNDHADDLDVMHGHEGSAARLYFETLGQLMTNPGFSQTGRNRRPQRLGELLAEFWLHVAV